MKQPNPRQKKPRPQHTGEELGLDVMSSEYDLFHWFLAAYLFGKPIQSSVAINTWRVFVEAKMDTPWAIIESSHRSLVQLLDEGKYTRYDEVMARALQRCMHQLIDQYDGSLILMIESSETEEEFSKRIQELYGVGPKTAEIFMRETVEYFARRVE